MSHDRLISNPLLCARSRASQSRWRRSGQVALILTFLCAGSCVLAQEPTPHSGNLGLVPLLMVYGVTPLQAPAKPLVTQPALSFETNSPFSCEEERQYESLFKNPKGSENEVFVLLRKKIPSRYAYESWAKVKPGFGQFFVDDVVARSRTSGVGVEDPEWLYIKMSLRF